MPRTPATGNDVLAVPNEGPLLGQLFGGTPWGGRGAGGTWSAALRQGPASLIVYDKSVNKQRVGGFSRRCTLVLIEDFVAMTDADE